MCSAATTTTTTTTTTIISTVCACQGVHCQSHSCVQLLLLQQLQEQQTTTILSTVCVLRQTTTTTTTTTTSTTTTTTTTTHVWMEQHWVCEHEPVYTVSCCHKADYNYNYDCDCCCSYYYYYLLLLLLLLLTCEWSSTGCVNVSLCTLFAVVTRQTTSRLVSCMDTLTTGDPLNLRRSWFDWRSKSRQTSTISNTSWHVLLITHSSSNCSRLCSSSSSSHSSSN